MIQRTNTTPNFKSLYTIPGFKELGVQGRMSLEITKPFLKDISNDCDIYLGAFGTKEQPKLTVYCSNLVEGIPKENILNRLFKTRIDLYTKTSCSKAVCPESMITNAQIAKADFLVEQKGNLEKVVELEGKFQEFSQSPKYLNEKNKYNDSFNRVPLPNELQQDRILSSYVTTMPLNLLKKRELVKF